MEALAQNHIDYYFPLRYRDFIARPKTTVRRILDFVGHSSPDLPFLDSSTVVLEENHTVWGNPSRGKTGRITLQRDSEWESEISLKDRLTVTGLTWPLLLRYGYIGSDVPSWAID
jgi:hypothetical protein